MNENTSLVRPHGDGVSAWIKVPAVAASGGSHPRGFTIDFSVIIWTRFGGTTGGDVTPARPTGKDVPAAPESMRTTTLASDCDCCAGGSQGLACVALSEGIQVAPEKSNFFELIILPGRASDNGTTLDVEVGPVSWSQGWLAGEATYEGFEENGDVEPTGCGPIWRDGADVILVSVLSPVAAPDPGGCTPDEQEFGVFAWVKLEDSDQDQGGAPRFEADFAATFSPGVGSHDGTVTLPDPQRFDISASDPVQGLVSIDLLDGRWTLYAKGPAVAPAGATYQVVAGPRSLAAIWIHSDAGKTWLADAARYGLITLTSRYEPL